MSAASTSAATFEALDDLDAINKLYRERRWSDGLHQAVETKENVPLEKALDYVAGIKAALELVGHPVGPARLPIQPLQPRIAIASPRSSNHCSPCDDVATCGHDSGKGARRDTRTHLPALWSDI